MWRCALLLCMLHPLYLFGENMTAGHLLLYKIQNTLLCAIQYKVTPLISKCHFSLLPRFKEVQSILVEPSPCGHIDIQTDCLISQESRIITDLRS